MRLVGKIIGFAHRANRIQGWNLIELGSKCFTDREALDVSHGALFGAHGLGWALLPRDVRPDHEVRVQS